MAAGSVGVFINNAVGRLGAIYDGVDDKLESTKNSNTLGTNWTITNWIMLKSQSGVDFVWYFDTAGANRLYIKISSTTQFSVGLSDWNPTIAGLTVNTWHHIALVCDGTTGYFYLDGVEAGTQAGITIDIPTATLTSGFTTYHGAVGDMKIYNRALPVADILKLANNIDVPSGLVNHWPLDTDYTDIIGGKDFTNTGTRLGIFEGTIAASYKLTRATANDVFLMTQSAGKQAICVSIEEAP